MTTGATHDYSLRDIAARYGGEIVGDPDTRVHQVATLEHGAPGTIAFLANERYLSQLKTTRASAVIVGASARDATALPRIVCENPYLYFARVATLLNPEPAPKPGVHASAIVDPSATLGSGVEVGPHVVVGAGAVIEDGCVIGAGCYVGEETRIGEATRLFPHVTIYHRCVIGARVRLHSGVVIGADGFGLAPDADRWFKIPQIGRVVIGDDVEIGANTTVDRGAIEDTVIEEGVKLDNLIMIAHNVRIGAHTAIAACAGVAGSARVGRHCRIGGSSGIAGHITLADHVEISAHTIITRSIDKAGTYTGAYPFEANREWRKNAAQLRHLNELAQRLRALENASGGKDRSGS
ncbi:MAG TPA: UDP-3-O-(3-hydroxymyristoyl)glucosamine N-acyltransferase [Burkholderiales bacterium]|nr:UDP-3-O-(3-hydroxymyristoyl)glucosamine N-acyltransferase [Burkholderiales bacterium]